MIEDGYYFFTSERASSKAVAQHVKGEWFCINKVGPVTLEELKRRGWDLGERIEGQDDP